MHTNRRKFLHNVAGLTAVTALTQWTETEKGFKTPISCNSYNWVTFYARDNKEWGKDLDACIAEFAKTGIKAYEPALGSAEEAVKLIAVLKKYGIVMPSIYVGSVMHKADEAEKSIANILSIADEVKKYGTKIIVTNPNPISWANKELKTDAELVIQAGAMEKLGKALKQKGLILAYHTHDAEMRGGAREFHHVMQNTSPKYVSFCYDVHWVFRGCADSKVAVFDILKLYGKRVVELHVRQSVNGIWSETFGDGDIDYPRFVNVLKEMNIYPHIVIEQCIEDKTPNTMSGVEAHVKDLAAFNKVFGSILR
jgi:inosose dehydratase